MKLRKTWMGAFAVALLAGSALAGPVRAPGERRSEGIPSANRGRSASVVMSGPGVAEAMLRTPDWVRPEYSRNNANLGYAPARALTAIDSWPRAQPPSLDFGRFLTLPRDPDTIMYFKSYPQPYPRELVPLVPRPYSRPHRHFGPLPY